MTGVVCDRRATTELNSNPVMPMPVSNSHHPTTAATPRPTRTPTLESITPTKWLEEELAAHAIAVRLDLPVNQVPMETTVGMVKLEVTVLPAKHSLIKVTMQLVAAVFAHVQPVVPEHPAHLVTRDQAEEAATQAHPAHPVVPDLMVRQVVRARKDHADLLAHVDPRENPDRRFPAMHHLAHPAHPVVPVHLETRVSPVATAEPVAKGQMDPTATRDQTAAQEAQDAQVPKARMDNLEPPVPATSAPLPVHHQDIKWTSQGTLLQSTKQRHDTYFYEYAMDFQDFLNVHSLNVVLIVAKFCTSSR